MKKLNLQVYDGERVPNNTDTNNLYLTGVELGYDGSLLGCDSIKNNKGKEVVEKIELVPATLTCNWSYIFPGYDCSNINGNLYVLYDGDGACSLAIPPKWDGVVPDMILPAGTVVYDGVVLDENDEALYTAKITVKEDMVVKYAAGDGAILESNIKLAVEPQFHFNTDNCNVEIHD